jgi:Tfp pilus assembly protein PilZ
LPARRFADEPGMHVAGDPRYRKRLPCRLRVPSGAHSGMVLNLSRGGLFVQTGAAASPGDAVQLDLTGDGDAEPMRVDGRVVWRRVVAPHLRTVSTGGMGVHIQYASDQYFGFVARLAEGVQADEAAPAPEAPGPAARPAGARAAAASAPPTPSFRVRLRYGGSSRTRIVVVAAADEREARARARDRLGAQWAVLDLDRVPRDA